MRFQDKVALVTGAGSGIGAATARRLAREGARVGVLDVGAQSAGEVVAAIREAGGAAQAIEADISDADSLQNAVAEFMNTAGRLDIVVANAGINGLWAPIEDIEAHEWDATQNVNGRGTFLTFKFCVPHLKKQGGSATIVSSLHGHAGLTIMGSTAYAASKAAQIHMARKLAVELARWEVRVNVVSPGYTRSRIGQSHSKRNIESIKLDISRAPGSGRLHVGPLDPDHIASAIAWLSSDEAAFITGVHLPIDGGESLVSG